MVMKIINVNPNHKYELEESVACIGNFDGVHLGHQALIKEVLKISEEKQIEPAAVLFSCDPADVIFPERKHFFSQLSNRPCSAI